MVSLENHDLVMAPKDQNDHRRMERISRLSDPSDPQLWYGVSRGRVATGLPAKALLVFAR